MEFAWKGYQIGDSVRITASEDVLETICAEDYKDYIGKIVKIHNDTITVEFINGTRIMFNTYMVEKTTGDYEDWLDSKEADLLAQAYAEAYN